MKTYPSISRKFRGFEAYVFDKLDGSNLRFEWSHKKGWNKYGTRHRLFDASDEVFGDAVHLFHDTLAAPVADVLKSLHLEKAVVFAEFWGPNSLAGCHDPEDTKRLTMFDVAPHKRGMMPPKEFIKRFDHLDTPAFLGKHNWSRGFVDKVWNGELEGVTFEGVVGKAKTGQHDWVAAKAKTKVWIEAIKSKFTSDEADKLIKS